MGRVLSLTQKVLSLTQNLRQSQKRSQGMKIKMCHLWQRQHPLPCQSLSVAPAVVACGATDYAARIHRRTLARVILTTRGVERRRGHCCKGRGSSSSSALV